MELNRELPNGHSIKHFPNGQTVYYDEKGEMHNEEGPAVVNPSGQIFFYHGELMDETFTPEFNVTHSNEKFGWFIHGVRYTSSEFYKLKRERILKML